MKILILTGSTGGGHNSAAKSLKKMCEENSMEVSVYDITARKDGMRNIPSTSYETVIKYVPQIYKFVYKSSNNRSIRLLNRLVRNSSEALYNAIKRHEPDLIISVHPIAIEMIRRFFRKGYEFNIPYIQVVTDFDAHKIYMNKFVDAYITPSEYTSLTISKRGDIPLSKIFDYGFPIEDRFVDKDKKELKLNNSVMILLGSMGFDNNIDKIYNLLDKDDKRKYYFVCARNEKLKHRLENKYKEKINEGKLEVLGFINNVDEIMKKSDLIITKVGGGSLSECINLRKPMVLINPIPGQEEENIKIMKMYGVGIDAKNNNLFEIIENMYENPEKFEEMLAGIDRITRNYGKENILNLINKVLILHKKN